MASKTAQDLQALLDAQLQPLGAAKSSSSPRTEFEQYHGVPNHGDTIIVPTPPARLSGLFDPPPRPKTRSKTLKPNWRRGDFRVNKPARRHPRAKALKSALRAVWRSTKDRVAFVGRHIQDQLEHRLRNIVLAARAVPSSAALLPTAPPPPSPSLSSLSPMAARRRLVRLRLPPQEYVRPRGRRTRAEMAEDRLMEKMVEVDELEWSLLDVMRKMAGQRDALLKEMLEDEREARSGQLERWMSENDRLFISRSPLKARLKELSTMA
ncbi:hypothetical protein LTR56_022525 [Elasticomyces elasticus]|nr:hypothetical protein LTR56_022525 [Elasticomyces elasticus]KAK3638966.1 hypothetical protein LTR22_017653 [Elasticomyces elasticus]KAK4931366.1 hypothetical protein LTR49_002067 [Elasticomyces elasticus]KAK5752603.1 hypothetical protein LTS12_017356 [Elasticomyces elasticus]